MNGTDGPFWALIGLVGFAWWCGARVARRREAAHIQHLSESRCARCSGIYGTRAALRAAYPGPSLFSREWWQLSFRGTETHLPYWKVLCPDCGEFCLYSLEERVVIGPSRAASSGGEPREVPPEQGHSEDTPSA